MQSLALTPAGKCKHFQDLHQPLKHVAISFIDFVIANGVAAICTSVARVVTMSAQFMI